MRRHADAAHRGIVNIYATAPYVPPSYGPVSNHAEATRRGFENIHASPQAPRRGLFSARPIEVCQLFKETLLLISFAFTPRLRTSNECFFLLLLPPSFFPSLLSPSLLLLLRRRRTRRPRHHDQVPASSAPPNPPSGCVFINFVDIGILF